jgi:hypothetical protein
MGTKGQADAKEKMISLLAFRANLKVSARNQRASMKKLLS